MNIAERGLLDVCLICLCLYIVVSNTCCSVFFVLYPMLPVSLDCSFFIAPSVFSNVYLNISQLLNEKHKQYRYIVGKYIMISLYSFRNWWKNELLVSFSSLFHSECKYILFLPKSPKPLPNFNEKSRRKCCSNRFQGVSSIQPHWEGESTRVGPRGPWV